MATFEIIRGPDTGTTIPLEGDDLVVGRGPEASIALTDEDVCEQHARLTLEGTEYVLTDLGSDTGVSVNGHRIKRLPLESGDEVCIGTTALRFNDDPTESGQAEAFDLQTEPTPQPESENAHQAASQSNPEPAAAGPAPNPEAEAAPQPPPQPEPDPAPATSQPQQAPAAAPSPEMEAAPQAPPQPQPEPATAQPQQAPASAPSPKPAVADDAADRVRSAKSLRTFRYARPLVKKVTCPNCWHLFPPEDVLFISKHPDLMNDPMLGTSEYRRFKPDRFTLKGEALDARGLPSADLACPRCHLPVPQAAVEVPPLFISIVGSPASGKSYFLTAMTHALRRTMPRFGLAFQDADPVANSVIREGEMTLFRNPNPDQLAEIPKTQQDDPRLHKTVHIDGVDIRHPLPFQFFLSPTPKHPRHADAGKIGRTIVLYDNAGEDCLPSHEEATSASTKHLARSGIIFLVYDPTQDPSFRAQCPSDDPQLHDGLRPGTGGVSLPYTQGTIANELAVRIRRHHAMPHDKRLDKPLIIIVAKFDIWRDLIDVSIDDEPFAEDEGGALPCLDTARIERTSNILRNFLERLCPDFVAIADNISTIVRFIPVTSLGQTPVVVKRRGATPFYGVRPSAMEPKWVTVPFLYCLSKFGQPGILGTTDNSR